MPRPPFAASKLPLSLSLSLISHLSSHRLAQTPCTCVCVPPLSLALASQRGDPFRRPITDTHVFYIYKYMCVYINGRARTHTHTTERRDFLLIDYSRDKRRELPAHLTSNNPFGLSAFSLFYFSLSVLSFVVVTVKKRPSIACIR